MAPTEAAESWYVYGVVASDNLSARGAAGPAGLDGRPVETVESGALAALVSPFPGQRARSSRAYLDAHQRVVEAAHVRGTVLPISFGTILPDKQSIVVELLDEHREELARMLEEMRGAVEFRLRVTYVSDTAVREAVSASKQIQRLQASVRNRPEAATYFDRVELGQMVADAVAFLRSQESAEIMRRLESFGDMIELPAHEDAVASLAFLLRPDEIAGFEAEVDQLGAEQAGRTHFALVGPLVPWDFIRLDAGNSPSRSGRN